MAARLGVRVLGVFGSAARPDAVAPGDLDVAVGFVGAPQELALLDVLTQLAGAETRRRTPPHRPPDSVAGSGPRTVP